MRRLWQPAKTARAKYRCCPFGFKPQHIPSGLSSSRRRSGLQPVRLAKAAYESRIPTEAILLHLHKTNGLGCQSGLPQMTGAGLHGSDVDDDHQHRASTQSPRRVLEYSGVRANHRRPPRRAPVRSTSCLATNQDLAVRHAGFKANP
jgi:hypothetical protein